MNLTLISHTLCPYVQRVAILLNEKRVEHARIDIDLREKPDWFLALSPLGKTPVLRVGEHAIFESAVICEYLEDTVAPTLHPTDPLQRARHRAWIEVASATLNEIWMLYTAQSKAAYASAASALTTRFAQVEQALGDGPWFSGERFSLVDAAFAPVFRYFDLFDRVDDVNPFSQTPKVRAWRSALSQRPSVQSTVSRDYSALLRQFVIDRQGILGKRLAAAA